MMERQFDKRALHQATPSSDLQLLTPLASTPLTPTSARPLSTSLLLLPSLSTLTLLGLNPPTAPDVPLPLNPPRLNPRSHNPTKAHLCEPSAAVGELRRLLALTALALLSLATDEPIAVLGSVVPFLARSEADEMDAEAMDRSSTVSRPPGPTPEVA